MYSLVILAVSLSVGHCAPQSRPRALPELILFTTDRWRGGESGETLVSGSGALNARAAEDQGVVLECEAASRFGPSIHWLHNGHKISQISAQKSMDDEDLLYDVSNPGTGFTRSRLYIDCMTHEHEGEYTCVASTPISRNVSSRVLSIGSITTTHHISPPAHLMYQVNLNNQPSAHLMCQAQSANLTTCTSNVPEKLPFHTKDKRKPWSHTKSDKERKTLCAKNKDSKQESSLTRITEFSTRLLVVEGDDARLVCRATGHPRPKIIWLDRDELPINNQDNQYEILDNGDLLIRKTTFKKNMGVYQCVADNGLSTDSVSAFLYPAGREIGSPAKDTSLDESR